MGQSLCLSEQGKELTPIARILKCPFYQKGSKWGQQCELRHCTHPTGFWTLNFLIARLWEALERVLWWQMHSPKPQCGCHHRPLDLQHQLHAKRLVTWHLRSHHLGAVNDFSTPFHICVSSDALSAVDEAEALFLTLRLIIIWNELSAK